MSKERTSLILLTFIGIALMVTLIINSPIHQDVKYHLFCNEVHYCGINNFWNVISNLPFLIAGLHGIFQMRKWKKLKYNYLVFYMGVSLVALGSSYYHYNPNNQNLIWDRLPMTIAFTAFVSIVLTEFVDKNIGELILTPLLIIGISSILYWVSKDDLSLYVFVQFYPVISIPVILLIFKTKNSPKTGYWLLILFYLIAKLLETYDHDIYHAIKIISGHPLKHVAAATGIYLFSRFSVNQSF